MGFPQLHPGEAIFLTRFEADPNKAIGVFGFAREFTLRQEMDFVWVDAFTKFPSEFRVDLNVNMLALRTMVVDIGQDIWTPPEPGVLPSPQPRLP
jgi:hypothetical protein